MPPSNWPPLEFDFPTILARESHPLKQLADGDVGALIVRQAFPADDCVALIDMLIDEELMFAGDDPRVDQSALKNKVIGKYLGRGVNPDESPRKRIDIGTSLGNLGDDKELFFQRAAETHDLFTRLFADRPNPIGGTLVEGPVLDAGGESFVGYHPIAVRHGMTLGELARMIRSELELELDLQVVQVENWRRDDYWDATGLTWINPSPNMRSLAQAVLYPGIGLLETTNLSVGRGTDTPFEVLGAPWIDAQQLAKELNDLSLAGVRFVPIQFTPDASKYANELCQGVNAIVVDRQSFRPVDAGLQIACTLRALYPDLWDTKGFNRLLINHEVFTAVVNGKDPETIKEICRDRLNQFVKRRAGFLIYSDLE